MFKHELHLFLWLFMTPRVGLSNSPSLWIFSHIFGRKTAPLSCVSSCGSLTSCCAWSSDHRFCTGTASRLCERSSGASTLSHDRIFTHICGTDLACCTCGFSCDHSGCLQMGNLPHRFCRNMVSPVCILMWTIKPDQCLKHIPQVLQEGGFSPLWSLPWALRDEEFLKLFPQVSRLKDFTSVWMIMCWLSLHSDLKSFPHIWHLKDSDKGSE